MTIAAWTVCTALAVLDMAVDGDQDPPLTLALGLAISLTTASLMATFIAPLDKVYRAGVEAGKDHHNPPLRLVSNAAIPITHVRERTRSDN
jgi:hypothetical protein